MTRERKEIFKEMEQLEMQESAEYELGCGFGTTEIYNTFAALWDKLYERLAATYGKTFEEYEAMCYENENRLYQAGAIPFN